ncbi:TPA_asm: dihydroxyacetone kinase, partial [Listeria monocytogenes]|nr:dihydroxyacetone kinase [Listeria monocytogenes]
ALSGATVPEVGKPGFELSDEEIEFGIGIHGEPGYRREKIGPSKVLAEELVNKLIESYDEKSGNFGILVNGMGSTPLMEQYVFANDVNSLLKENGIKVIYKKIGDLMTSIDMAGISLTLIRLEEEEWLDALNSPVTTIAW